jgi:hypothetical protein
MRAPREGGELIADDSEKTGDEYALIAERPE